MIFKRKPRDIEEQPVDVIDADVSAAPSAATQTGTEPAGVDRPAMLDKLWSEPAPEVTDALPRFIATASDDVEDSAAADRVRRRLALRDALGASQPVINRDGFAGRHDALARLINAVEQSRVHVVVYGERGIGKTSLAHVFAQTAREARYLVLYATCSTQADFTEMFRAIASRIARIYHASVVPNSPEAEKGDALDVLLPLGRFGPREVSDVFAGILGTRVIVILDEYDRVANVEFRRDVAELVKNLSDRAARMQLVITGVAQNLDELIGYAPSIRRNIVGLPMGPMQDGEVLDLLRIGERAADVRFSPECTRMIRIVAGGSPYLVRLLGHQAGMLALDAGRSMVTEADGRGAIERVLTDWNASLPRRVQVSLGRPEARSHWSLLVAAARAGSHADGWFTVPEVAAELGGDLAPLVVERELRSFCGPGDLIERHDGQTEARYRFGFPGVASLLLMSAAMARLAA